MTQRISGFAEPALDSQFMAIVYVLERSCKSKNCDYCPRYHRCLQIFDGICDLSSRHNLKDSEAARSLSKLL